MQRRKFIQSACQCCLLAAAGYAVEQLAACTPGLQVYKTAINNNRVAIPASLFEKSALQLVRPQGWYFDIAVRKNTDNSYTALLLKCTHQDNQLSVAGNGYTCSLHGSQFDATGKVRKGPAEKHLQTYTATAVDNNILISI